MANKEAIVKVKLSVNSKEYNQAIRAANQEAKEFKRQQREAFKNAGANEGMNALLATAKKLAPAISAGSAAFAVVNKAMKENQTFTDEWARITEGARASYESFVDTLVNGSFEGFFRNIDKVILRAREAADAFDVLDTATIFYNRDMSKILMRAEEYQSVIRSTTSSTQEKDAAKQNLLEVRKADEDLSRVINNLRYEAGASLLVEYATNKAGNKYAGRNPRTFSVSDFIEKNSEGFYELKAGGLGEAWFKDLDTYMSRVTQYTQEVEEWKKASGNSIARYNMIQKGSLAEGAIFAELSDEKLEKIFSLFNAGDEAMRSFYSRSKSDRRYLTASTSTPTSAITADAGSIAAIQSEISQASKELVQTADDFVAHTLRRRIEQLNMDLLYAETKHLNLGTGKTLEGITGSLALNPALVGQHLANIPITPSEGSVEDLEDNTKASEYATQGLNLLTDTIGRLGLMSNIVEPEVSKFLNVFGSILSQVGLSIGGPAGGVLSGIGGLLGGFAGGGIVGGTSYKGDQLLQAVNSKEVILNGYQQKNLLEMINAGGGGSQSISYVLRGEDIYMAISNYKRRTRKS